MCHSSLGAQQSSTNQSTQYRVSRILETSDDGECHADLVFDMRGSSPCSSPSSTQNQVRVVHFYIGDSDDEFREDGVIRTIIEELDDDSGSEQPVEPLYDILLDSGADASIFPVSLLGKGDPVHEAVGRLCDAQGVEIPIESVQDMEIRLKDISGRNILLKECVAVSSRVHQPILSFGHLLQEGWTIDGKQQALTHHLGAHIPVCLQNKSLMIQGTIRVMREECEPVDHFHVRAIEAAVSEDVLRGRVGWELNAEGCGIGRHFSDKFQDPSLVRPGLAGHLCRTTLVEGDDQKWYVLELCERLDGLVQYDAEFHDMNGKRNVITIITNGEQDPRQMGFTMVADDEQSHERAQPEIDFREAAGDVDIPGDDVELIGQDVPAEGRVVVAPSPEDEVTVNGVVLTPASALATLRTGCTYYNLSTSGGKQRCFQRILEHQKRLELELILAASRDANQQAERVANAPPVATPPSDLEQSKHRLTHLPYAAWCSSCVAHRARPNRHENKGESHAGEIPTVSFDFFYTKADGEAPDGADDVADSILSLIIVCSHTGFTACVPLQSKNQMDVMNRELIQFVQMLGHSEIIFHCDNEPSILQLQRLAVKTRQNMGFKTRMSSSVTYDHAGNSLAENAIGRVRALACSLMHQLQGRLGVKLSTKNAMWSWALRHAAWLISRFSVIRGATAHELAFGGKRYDGELCEYGEPVFAYIQPTTKASARWKRMVFLGKAEVQNSYVLFDGESVVMSRSVRRIGTTWQSHLGYYVHCKCFSWQFKSGFGARILPTMKKVVPKAVSFEVPLGRLEDTRFHDAEAEAVILHAEKEQRREEEQWNMSRNDQRWEQPAANVPADPGGVDSAPGTENPGGASSGSGVPVDDPGWVVPQTPPMQYVDLELDRGGAVTRQAEPSVDEAEAKRAKVEDMKRQRINRLKADYEERLSAVKIAYKEYFTMDDYSTDLDVSDPADGVQDDDLWEGEDDVKIENSPDIVWSDHPIDSTPTLPPSFEVEEAADRIEVERLVAMGVLVPSHDFPGEITGKLTTKFVRDWRLKPFGDGRRWMRRSRFVAREFAWEKRTDTFSPATSTHISNLLPMLYLSSKAAASEVKDGSHDVVLGSLDVKDAFLMVQQTHPIAITLQGQEFVIQRNLPGQRLGQSSGLTI